MTTNPEEQSSTKTPDQLTGWEEVAALAKTPEEFATDLKRGEAPDTTSDTAASIDSEIDPADEGIPYDKYGEYDDYEEPDPNSPEARFFAKYDAYEKLEPHFKSSIHGLLDQSDEHDIFSDKYDNFLITADFLPELADCTEDRDIAIIARGDFEDTLDDWAKEQGYDYQDDEDSDHLTNQVLAASAILAARLHADGDISSRQLDLSKRVINNLGLSIPFNPNDRYVRDALDNMTQHGFDLNDQLKAAGLLDQSFYNDIHQNDLVRVFKEAHVDVPEHLQNFSPEMQKYWNDISDELGIDAFTIYLDSVKSSLRHSQIQNPDHPVSPAIYFDDAGQPTPIAFAEGSTLFADAFRSPHEHKAHPDASYALLNKFSDKLVPTDKCLLDALGNAIAENDDEHLRSGLIHFYHTSYSRDDFDDTGHPNEIFWSRAGHSDDLGIIRLFPGYEEHFSPSRIAAAHLPANTREHLRRYTDKFWGKEDAVLDETLMPDGQLSQKFYSGKVLGNLSAENLVKDFPNELAEHFDATARSYLDLPSSYRDFLIQHSEDLAKTSLILTTKNILRIISTNPVRPTPFLRTLFPTAALICFSIHPSVKRKTSLFPPTSVTPSVNISKSSWTTPTTVAMSLLNMHTPSLCLTSTACLTNKLILSPALSIASLILMPTSSVTLAVIFYAISSAPTTPSEPLIQSKKFSCAIICPTPAKFFALSKFYILPIPPSITNSPVQALLLMAY